jgi:hypothetical protein
LFHSISRQKLRIKALGESEFDLLKLRMRAYSTEKYSGQERRVVGSGGIFIGSLKNLPVGLRFKFRIKSGGSQTMFD